MRSIITNGLRIWRLQRVETKSRVHRLLAQTPFQVFLTLLGFGDVARALENEQSFSRLRNELKPGGNSDLAIVPPALP